VDRSLWLLLKLRAVGILRRIKKTLSRPKGIVMAVITAMLFVPWFISIVMTSQINVKPPLEQIRLFAPLGLFVFTVGSLLFSAGEQALYYLPAEVTFLFAGPFSRRQILGYKLFTMLLLCLFSALFFTMACTMISPRLISAFFGSLVLIVFLQTLQMVVGLAGSTLGALAWSRGRRLILVGLVVVVGLVLVSVGRELSGLGLLEAFKKVESSPVATVILAPFQWFVYAFTAERIWPDLVQWSALCGLIDLALLGLVFALDASYLEAASASSAKRFARLQRLGGGGGGIRSMGKRPTGRLRFRPPNPPWWGGVGPNFWRQMTGALGDPGRLAGVIVMIAVVPTVMIFVAPADPRQSAPLVYVCMGMIAWMSIVFSMLIPYDFRGDIDLMEELKVLPISPARLALGQLLTPTLIATIAQSVGMVVVVAGLGSPDLVFWTFLAFLLPVNFLFYAVENLLFLWYPSRVVAGQFDVMAIGRQVIFMLAKMLGLGLGLGLAALVGTIVYFLDGRNAVPAIACSWLTMVAAALGLVPLVGEAFRRFDVSRDVPA
jgi:Putative ABC exporter